MAVITISREYGSWGDEIAMQLCLVLSYRYFDKRMMVLAAKEMGISETDMFDFSEREHKIQGLFERLFKRPQPVAQVRTWRETVSGTQVLETKALDAAEAVKTVRLAVETACREDYMVIVGRGGQAILKGKPNVLHVRFSAPIEERVKRVKEVEKLRTVEARQRIVEHDARTADYLKRFYDIDWADPLNYHMVINTGQWSIDQSVRLIVEAVHLLQPVNVAR